MLLQRVKVEVDLIGRRGVPFDPDNFVADSEALSGRI